MQVSGCQLPKGFRAPFSPGFKVLRYWEIKVPTHVSDEDREGKNDGKCPQLFLEAHGGPWEVTGRQALSDTGHWALGLWGGEGNRDSPAGPTAPRLLPPSLEEEEQVSEPHTHSRSPPLPLHVQST